jgi:protein-S-isoprenylcysteine O-methyltransferase Ste14
MAGAMWGISTLAPLIEVPARARIVVAALIGLMGIAFDVAGLISFRVAKTTINPLRPQTTAFLVGTGIYRRTRNPMYVGLTILLVAWAVFLSSAWALLGPLVFVLYITRFQIVPEERMLAAKFGAEYSAYKATVRRWL